MADIELVIKITEKDWEFVKASEGCRYSRTIMDSVINGTPLPKGHGKIIDVSEYFKKEFGDAREFLDKATTIIEADTEGEGE